MTIKGGFGKIVLEIILQNKKYKGPVIYVGSGLRNFHKILVWFSYSDPFQLRRGNSSILGGDFSLGDFFGKE